MAATMTAQSSAEAFTMRGADGLAAKANGPVKSDKTNPARIAERMVKFGASCQPRIQLHIY